MSIISINLFTCGYPVKLVNGSSICINVKTRLGYRTSTSIGVLAIRGVQPSRQLD